MEAKKLYSASELLTDVPILGGSERLDLTHVSLKTLESDTRLPQALVLDCNSSSEWTNADFAKWRADHPLLPVLILESNVSSAEDHLPESLGVRFDSVDTLIAAAESIGRFSSEIDPLHTHVSLPSSATRTEGQFFQVSIRECFHGQILPFDVYVKLSEEHFVKILQEGESFSESQVKKYVEKGVRFLYIKNSDRDLVLQELLSWIDTMLSTHKSQTTQITQAVKHYGAETLEALKACGVSETRIQHALSFVNRAEKVLHKTGLTQSEQVRAALSDIEQYDHAVSTTLILSLVSEHFEVDRELFGAILGPAALLHDIGLHGLPSNCQTESEALMTSQERKLYRTHTERAVQILEDSGVKLPGLMIEVIRQHHQRRNLSGFPMKRAGEETHKFAELLGAADELVRLIHQSQVQPSFKPFDHFEQHTLKGFSRHVEMAFRPLLLQAKTSGQ